MKDLIKKYIEEEVKAIKNIPVDGKIEILLTSFIKKFIWTMEKSSLAEWAAGQIGMNIATTLSSTGTPAAFIHPE